jgi:hypothetical protein
MLSHNQRGSRYGQSHSGNERSSTMEKTMKMDRFAPLTQDEMFEVNGGYYTSFDDYYFIYLMDLSRQWPSGSAMRRMYENMANSFLQWSVAKAQ